MSSATYTKLLTDPLRIPHELLTPLSSILLYAELVIDEEPNNLSHREITPMARSIQSAAHRLLETIHKYLLYNELQILRFTERKSKLREIQDNLHDIILHTGRAVAGKWKRQEDLREILGDSAVRACIPYFCHVVRQLVDNACKFSPIGSPITLQYFKSNGEVTLSIKDQGRGISTEDTKRLGAFQQFERNRYEQQGSGLGLAIVKHILEYNRGTLNIQSVPNEGTTVTVTFPITAESE
ncbi:sensor histidine kinase [Chrysiogenes arsenatis]|uniref:sensor histidine kinase n=1 Tax=Chrysiogenes arsenatis TaxID=309797 RepID=UPI0003FCD53E|nr:HAMP domain-containing sensor histidine kinase [Chrysiogenes arsenatis]